ncbi:MAG: toll/interleukin-1 receptor domain-containing protein [Anaerolineae bacterium]|nr:toll/interleukin-1 receptor domain-containing protein [Anaerolineae bacterium]
MGKQNVFISYSHADRNMAVQIASLLSKEGLNIWIDVEDIPPGENWRNAIEDGLKTAEVMLLLVSPESMASAEVQGEWNYFLDEKKPIIPILLRPTEIPSRLRLIQWIDFSQGSGSLLENYARLHDRLKGEAVTLRDNNRQAFPAGQNPSAHLPPSHDGGANRTQIIIALIGAAAVVVAAVIGLLPILLNRPDTSLPTTTVAAVISTATVDPAGTAVTPQPTALPAATSTPSVPRGTFDITLIYNQSDSFIVQANKPSSFDGLVLRTTSEESVLTAFFTDLAPVGFVLQSGECLVFVRTGESPPPPRACQKSYEYEMVSAETFWYDNQRNRARDLALVLDENILGICSAQGGAGVCDFTEP